ncbi:class B sortase [Lagierella massiliensis]|uniref:class B sortase n=1 Tax=Lagierella massiliensis TaxID=1689303 RepID=UPI0006D82180|nr:class B sortase [Lagierella massiliensis]
MKRKIISIIQVLLILVLLWSGYKIYLYQQDNKSYKEVDKDYQEIRDNSLKENIQESNEEEEDSEIKSAILFVRDLNKNYPQIKARILIDNLEMDFPVVQGKDNSFYLNHDYKGNYHPFGAVFMDCVNSIDFKDQNTILYGHNVKSGHVFNPLNKYRDEKYVEDNPYIIIDSLEGRFTYEIFAVYEANQYEEYRLPSYDEEDFEEFISRIEEKNFLDRQLPNKDDKILTLSTCSDIDDRMVVQAKLVKIEK